MESLGLLKYIYNRYVSHFLCQSIRFAAIFWQCHFLVVKTSLQGGYKDTTLRNALAYRIHHICFRGAAASTKGVFTSKDDTFENSKQILYWLKKLERVLWGWYVGSNNKQLQLNTRVTLIIRRKTTKISYKMDFLIR